MYKEDLPSHYFLLSKLHCWYLKKNESDTRRSVALPTTPTQALCHNTCMFPNIKIFLANVSTLPVAACSSERSHSSLKRIKTTIGSRMNNERLVGLSILHST